MLAQKITEYHDTARLRPATALRLAWLAQANKQFKQEIPSIRDNFPVGLSFKYNSSGFWCGLRLVLKASSFVQGQYFTSMDNWLYHHTMSCTSRQKVKGKGKGLGQGMGSEDLEKTEFVTYTPGEFLPFPTCSLACPVILCRGELPTHYRPIPVLGGRGSCLRRISVFLPLHDSDWSVLPGSPQSHRSVIFLPVLVLDKSIKDRDRRELCDFTVWSFSSSCWHLRLSAKFFSLSSDSLRLLKEAI